MEWKMENSRKHNSANDRCGFLIKSEEEVAEDWRLFICFRIRVLISCCRYSRWLWSDFLLKWYIFFPTRWKTGEIRYPIYIAKIKQLNNGMKIFCLLMKWIVLNAVWYWDENMKDEQEENRELSTHQQIDEEKFDTFHNIEDPRNRPSRIH